MSDVSKTNELIGRLRSMATDIDELLDDPESLLDIDDVAVIINEAADALAARVPVQGEPSDDREALARLLPEVANGWLDEPADFERYPEYYLGHADPILAAGFSRATVSDAAPTLCEWCTQPARGDAWHNDGKLHPSCGQIDHGQGWVPDAATEELERIKPLFENLSREYPNECNKRVKAEAERDAAVAAVERVRAIAETWQYGMPEYTSSTYQEGQKDQQRKLVGELLAALAGAPEPEGRWEYRGRLQSCGYVAEGYISAEHAMNGLKVELEDHPYLQMDDTAIVERARVREWLPVEGESK